MRGYFVYYLKILWAICVVHESAANAMRISRNDAYKKLLSLRSLPFEDCGEYLGVPSPGGYNPR